MSHLLVFFPWFFLELAAKSGKNAGTFFLNKLSAKNKIMSKHNQKALWVTLVSHLFTVHVEGKSHRKGY